MELHGADGVQLDRRRRRHQESTGGHGGGDGKCGGAAGHTVSVERVCVFAFVSMYDAQLGAIEGDTHAYIHTH